MKLYPQDLREQLHAEVIRRRSHAGQTLTETTGADVTPHLGRLGQIWSRGLSLNPRQAAIAMPAAADTTQSVAWLSQFFLTGFTGLVTAILAKKGIISSPEAWGAMALAAGATVYPSFVTWPRAALKYLYKKPLSVGEIEKLIPNANTDLERSYLDLVRHTILQPVPTEAQDDVRTAVVSLGEAVDALPFINPTQTDTNALREEAIALKAQAVMEADTIIAESLGHQAEAILRRADAADRSVQYARRISALRKEIAAQIAAVQEDLSTFNSTNGAVIDRVSLSQLAEGARRVATISVSAASARAELDGVLSGQLPSPPIPVAKDWQHNPAVQEEPAQNLQITIK